jgi:triosephosphate isomerase
MKYLLANWKMYTTAIEAVALFGDIQQGLRERAEAGKRFPLPIICPPFLSLVPIRALTDHELVRLGAQNCHWEAEGPYTGEISPTMLRDVADYVLIGHSERRAAGETNEVIAKKVNAAAEAGLTPILFVGEDEPTDAAAQETDERLAVGVSSVDLKEHPVLVVYEPTWAVGADRPAEAGHVQEVVDHLKVRLRELGAGDPEVIYGGTVTGDNIDQFARLEVLDGVGATRASLDAGEFLEMLDRLAAVRRRQRADTRAP